MVDHWEDRFESKPGRTVLLVTCVVIAFVLAISAVLWALGVFTSPVRGAGDAYAEKNGAGNFIAQQAVFVSRNEDYKAKLQQIHDIHETVKAEQTTPKPTDGLAAYEAQRQLSNDQATVQQLVMGCQRAATEYNTAGQLYLAQDFKNAGLPYRLDYATCSVAATG